VSVNKTSYTEMLMEHMLPLIRAKFPGDVNGRRITVQQDNAPPHTYSLVILSGVRQ